ncbi:MAG TPA: beta-ketoacyl synthase N-terminal-like domain-containing protein [Nocardioidaceae bacterium]|nr:beta-ketoacyl synthase N-terminal-like domain-containing protein [Nocardioidaceae bacterium]
MSADIFVTAASALWPGGRGVDSILDPDASGQPSPPKTVPDHDLASALTLRGLRPLSRTARLAMVAAADVWPPGTPGTSRDAVVLGSRWSSSGPLAEFVQVAAAEGADRVFPMAFPNTVASVHAGYVATLLGLTGPVVTACGEAAGMEAVIEGLSLIAGGRADRVLAIGADAAEEAVATTRPNATEASGAVRISRLTEGDPVAVVADWWVGATPQDLPSQAVDGSPHLELVGDCGAALGALRVAVAAHLASRERRPVFVLGSCGVRGVAALRLDPV